MNTGSDDGGRRGQDDSIYWQDSVNDIAGRSGAAVRSRESESDVRREGRIRERGIGSSVAVAVRAGGDEGLGSRAVNDCG